jgi:hypothetical protein
LGYDINHQGLRLVDLCFYAFYTFLLGKSVFRLAEHFGWPPAAAMQVATRVVRSGEKLLRFTVFVL